MKVGTDGVLLGAWAPTDGASRALDIGTGTGLIAIMLAQRGIPHITAVEIDPDACAEAIANVKHSPWSDKVRIVNADFLTYNPQQAYDLIVSNPPYFDETLESPDLRRAMARSQSSLPLDSLIARAASMLSAGGKMALILPYSQVNRLTYAAAINHLNVNHIIEVAHHQGRAPKRFMTLISRNVTSTYHQSLYIQSSEYSTLTKDFYL